MLKLNQTDFFTLSAEFVNPNLTNVHIDFGKTKPNHEL